MRSKRTTPEEQLRLINECRQSGLTDYEWCQQHGIKAATFYVWIHRLKQKGIIDTPAVIPTVVRQKKGKQDVVKVEIEEESSLSSAAAHIETLEKTVEDSLSAGHCEYPVMEVILHDIRFRVTNEVNPKLLAETIRLLRGTRC